MSVSRLFNASYGFVFIPIFIGVVLIMIGVGVFWLKFNLQAEGQAIDQQALNQKSQEVLKEKEEESKWKTYTNKKYGYSLKYPRVGMTLAEEDYLEAECGNAIQTKKKQEGRVISSFVTDVIGVDNFFEILVLEGPESIDEYLENIWAKNDYNLEFFDGSLADEAVEVKGLKVGAEYAVGYPPLTYVTHIFRKGEKIFLIKNLIHPVNLGGCIHPDWLDPVKHAHLKVRNWDLKESFKFL